MTRERFFLELEPPDQRLQITLVDQHDYHQFQPLLYQVATGLVAEADVASPLRQLVGQAPNVQVLLGEVEEIDTQAKQVVFNDRQLAYDHLVLAAGSGSSYFGHDEWREAAPPMKILEHADEIRRRVLLALEEAEQTPDPTRRAFLQSVVVVGGGPSGCELSGSLMELMVHALGRDFKQLDPKQCKVTLVDPGDRVLRAMDPSLSAAAGTYLQSAGVELLLGGRVQTIEAGKVEVNTAAGPRTLEAATICWTAGVKASHLGQVLADASGCSVDRGGRVVVEPDFSIPNHPEIRVIGDLCSYSHTSDGKPLAGMAGPAVQMGGWVAADIVAKIQGQAHKAFTFTDFGTMAVLGPLHAVADLRGLKLSGLPGWILWGLAHLMFMPANENRLTLLTKWLWAIATRQRASMLITGRPNQHLNVEVGLERPTPAA